MTDGTSNFVYVTYIRTTPEALWSALTTTDFMKKYWLGMAIETDWQPGSSWKLTFPDGRIADDGEVLAFEPPRRIVLQWHHRLTPGAAEEGPSCCTIEVEPLEKAVKLTISHTIAHPASKLIEAVSGGWPKILSNLKSLLETGETLLT